MTGNSGTAATRIVQHLILTVSTLAGLFVTNASEALRASAPVCFSR